MGGDTTVTSELGKGTVFTVPLPTNGVANPKTKIRPSDRASMNRVEGKAALIPGGGAGIVGAATGEFIAAEILLHCICRLLTGIVAKITEQMLWNGNLKQSNSLVLRRSRPYQRLPGSTLGLGKDSWSRQRHPMPSFAELRDTYVAAVRGPGRAPKGNRRWRIVVTEFARGDG